MEAGTPRISPRISHIGTSGLLFEAPGDFCLSVQARIWRMAGQAAAWPGVAEAVPGVTNLLLVFDGPPASVTPLRGALLAAWDESSGAVAPEGRLIEVAVSYGGRHGADLQAVAAHSGLDPDEVVRRHAAAEYRVFAVGSQPGFAYLGGLDPAIAVPRKAVPVLHIPAGTVVIGGSQTGVVASAGPNGWNAIGHTDAALFDPALQPPTLFSPADRVRFRPLGVAA